MELDNALNDKIELTPDELLTVAKAVWNWPEHPEDQACQVDTVADVVAAINRVRGGDPIGTIRRRPYGDCIALRVSAKPSPGDRGDVHWWRILDPDSEKVFHGGQKFVQDWPIIFSPEKP